MGILNFIKDTFSVGKAIQSKTSYLFEPETRLKTDTPGLNIVASSINFVKDNPITTGVSLATLPLGGGGVAVKAATSIWKATPGTLKLASMVGVPIAASGYTAITGDPTKTVSKGIDIIGSVQLEQWGKAAKGGSDIIKNVTADPFNKQTWTTALQDIKNLPKGPVIATTVATGAVAWAGSRVFSNYYAGSQMDDVADTVRSQTVTSTSQLPPGFFDNKPSKNDEKLQELEVKHRVERDDEMAEFQKDMAEKVFKRDTEIEAKRFKAEQKERDRQYELEKKAQKALTKLGATPEQAAQMAPITANPYEEQPDVIVTQVTPKRKATTTKKKTTKKKTTKKKKITKKKKKKSLNTRKKKKK